MTATPANCFHLSVGIVMEIHREALARFGGSDGIRELTLLESAIAAPQATFGGQSPYHDLEEMAAAYLFHLCKNHPFIDGNKRTALGSCLVFLRLNGMETKPDHPDWEVLTLDVASSRIGRDQTTRRLRKLVRRNHKKH